VTFSNIRARRAFGEKASSLYTRSNDIAFLMIGCCNKFLGFKYLHLFG
jgi:hypothetical protein